MQRNPAQMLRKQSAQTQSTTSISSISPGTDRLAAEMLNGLPIMPEIESIRVHESNVAPFSMPSEALTFIPDKGAVVSCYKNGVTERKLYCNTELTETEQSNLQRLQEEARAQNLVFLPSIAAAAMRYVTRASGDAKRALKEMLATQEWRQGFFRDGPIIDSAVAEDMSHGAVYFAGRDHQLHPVLVIRPARIPASWWKEKGTERLTRLLVFSLEYMLRYLVYPGKVETSVILLDLKGVSLGQLPTSALREVITILSVHYILRVHRFYLCNVPSMIQRVSGLGLRLLTERQKQKLQLVKSFDDIRQYFALHQLEEDLGGTRPVIAKFFPFPLQAGPFTAGYSKGVDQQAVSHVYRAFTAAGIRGRAWDPLLSGDANAQVEYTEFAEAIFRRCVVPVPKSSSTSAVPVELAANVGSIDGGKIRKDETDAKPDMPVLLGKVSFAESANGTKVPEVDDLVADSTDVIVRPAERRATLIDEAKSTDKTDSNVMRTVDCDSAVNESNPVGVTVSRETVDHAVVDDVQFRPAGWFSCMARSANKISL